MKYRVLVTGGCGFAGRHVVSELNRAGFRVRVVDDLSAPGSTPLDPQQCELLRVDLRDLSSVLHAFRDIDICVALAAKSAGIGYFNKHPAQMLDDNVRITSSTFEAARICGMQRLIYVSSSCVFDRSDAHPITEDALKSSPPPPSGYPFSKFVGEMYCEAYHRQYGLQYTILRPFNLYGPGEQPGREIGDSHVIPDLTMKILSGASPLEILGDGQQTRSFTHVSDFARGVCAAIKVPLAVNEDFNLGHPIEIKILDLARLLWRICGRTDEFAFKPVNGYELDVRRRGVDISKARQLLEWEPQEDLTGGLSDVVDWLREHTATMPLSVI
jgi:UDP-glucose 4-epimerase